jgi:hypothetical protein
VTESQASEVARNGDIAWAHINRWDEDEVAWISEATRYPSNIRPFAEESCR